MVRDIRKVVNRKTLKIFFFNPLVCPGFSIDGSYVIVPISPRLILITITIKVAIVTSHVLRRLALELGFYHLFSS